VLWKLQRAYFEAQGLAACSRATEPFFATATAFAAHAYACQVAAFLRDTGVGDDAQPPYVVELAAGSGRLAWSFLNAWRELGAPQRLCYVLTDPAQRTVEAWRRHPQLSALAEEGVLDFARFDFEQADLEQESRLRLLHSGVELRPGGGPGARGGSPLVAIAHHAFAAARQDAFAVVDGELLECRLTLAAPPEIRAVEEILGGALDDLHIGHDYRRIDLPYYGDPVLDDLLDEYRRELGAGHLLLPLAAFRALSTLAGLGESGLLLLSADLGAHRIEDLRGTPPPQPSRHGSIALEVNHHALGRWVESLGGRAVSPRPSRDRLAVHTYLLDGGGYDLTATRLAATEGGGSLGPDAFFALQRRLVQHLGEMPLAEILAYLALSRWETEVMQLCLPRLQELAAAGIPASEREALADAVDRVWAGHLHLGEPFDLAFELGSLLATAELSAQALPYFERSLERYGEHTATLFNLGLCYSRLAELEPARLCCRHALELDGGNEEARALLLRLDTGSPGESDPDVPEVPPGTAAAPRRERRPEAYGSNLEHLRGELELLNARLESEVARWRATHPPESTQDQLMGFRLSDLGADVTLASFAQATDGPGALLAPRAALHAERERAALAAGIPLRLPELARRLGLDDFERAVVLLALAPEIDQRYERLFGYLNDDMSRRCPTVEHALRLFLTGSEGRHARRQTFAEGATLRARRLLRLSDDEGPLPPVWRSRGLRLETRTLGFLLDRDPLAASEPELTPFLESLAGDGSGAAPAVGGEAVRNGIAELRDFLAKTPAPAPIVSLDGPDSLLLRQVAAHLAGAGGLLVLRGAAVAAAGDPEDKVARALREVELSGAALLVEEATALRQEGRPSLALLRLLTAPCSRPRLLAAAAPWPLPEPCLAVPTLALHVPAPDHAARVELWHRALAGVPLEVDLGELAGRFRLQSAQIAGAAGRIRAQLRSRAQEGEAASPGLPAGRREVFAACRAQCFVSLEGLAERISSVHGWEDLVLPGAIKAQLRGIESWLRHRHVVFEDWGFAEQVSVGRGMAAMFCGSSGTGKTMAAGILARTLDLDLYRIDLSAVVSKYIGETEKNLARIFDAAAAANAILFFDEADALFGKRSEVKDAHDRHANVEVSYLLQRMESYDGIAILATNLRNNLDVAFSRRLQMIVEFPFPGIADRERIWRRLFTERVPQAPDVDLAYLAKQFGLAGGNIKNCAVAAALAAAAEGRPVEMRHLMQAIAREFEKIGKSVAPALFAPYGGVVP
jgi:tetratricopeptide (TPR) repeat protein